MNDNSNKTIILIGGGTGGHAIPILELYNKLKNHSELTPIIICGKSKLERKIFLKVANYKRITTGKFHRRFTIYNAIEAIKFFVGLITSYYYLKKYKPALIFSKGGYVSLPIVKIAQIMDVPYFIHESDLEMGMANKIAAKKAKLIFVGYPVNNYTHISQDKLIYSGQLISDKFIADKNGQKIDFGFIDNLPTILFSGGSQGSKNLNDNIIQSLPNLLKSYNIIHQAGDRNIDEIKSITADLSLEQKHRYFITDFLNKDKNSMARAINVSDLIVARAGANSIAEIALKSKPMILVPYKYAAGDHQTKNAQLLNNQKAAVVIPDDKLTPKILTDAIEKVMDDKTKRDNLVKNAKEQFKSNGLNLVARKILNFINQD